MNGNINAGGGVQNAQRSSFPQKQTLPSWPLPSIFSNLKNYCPSPTPRISTHVANPAKWLCLPSSCIKVPRRENSLAIQWLGLGALTDKGAGSIPGQGTKIPQAARHSQKKKKKKIPRRNERWPRLTGQVSYGTEATEAQVTCICYPCDVRKAKPSHYGYL